jgi:molybdopterin synthase catalytic subunit
MKRMGKWRSRTPHRHQAFEACRWLIDTLKEVVPIWKRETWDDGKEEWVHPGMDVSGGPEKD